MSRSAKTCSKYESKQCRSKTMHLFDVAKLQVSSLISDAWNRAQKAGKSVAGLPAGSVEIPRNPALGDFAATHVLAARTQMQGLSPQDAARIFAEYIELEGSYFSSFSVSESGFINFTLSGEWYSQVLQTAEPAECANTAPKSAPKPNYGRKDKENPDYFIRYACERIHKITSILAAEGICVNDGCCANTDLLETCYERGLIKQIAQTPDRAYLYSAQCDREKRFKYAYELAEKFYRFYYNCRIIGAQPPLAQARLKLAKTASSAICRCMDDDR